MPLCFHISALVDTVLSSKIKRLCCCKDANHFACVFRKSVANLFIWKHSGVRVEPIVPRTMICIAEVTINVLFL